MTERKLIILFISFAAFFSCEQKAINFNIRELKFNGLKHSSTKEVIIKSFGQPKIQAFVCGFSEDNDIDTLEQLVYKDFSFVGGYNDKFVLYKIQFDSLGEIYLEHGDKKLSGLTTTTDFAKIFGDKAKDYMRKNPNNGSILLFSKDSDEGGTFTFRDQKLIRYEYWTPC